MKMHVLEASAKKLLGELEEKLERKQVKNSGRVKDWLWQKYRLEWILETLRDRLQPLADIEQAGLSRFAAFVVMAGVRLPVGYELVPAACNELRALGFEIISLSAHGVFDPKAIGGEDFA